MTPEEKPTRLRAVALRYDEARDAAPKVIAKGKGYVAEQIIALARENGIHVHDDPDLVVLLAKLDIDQHIPESLYKAVAEILAFIYALNNRQRAL